MRWALILIFLFVAARASAFEIKSESFLNGADIGSKYTCDADNVSPEISWIDAPDKTQSFALICDDPDSPSGTWTHWIIFNIPKEKTSLKENLPTIGTFDDGMIQGRNDFGKTGYYGPCPPYGTHRYFFKLYALDVELLLDENSSKEDLLERMQGHVLGQTQMYCKYQR